jgi:hypothetical protein
MLLVTGDSLEYQISNAIEDFVRPRHIPQQRRLYCPRKVECNLPGRASSARNPYSIRHPRSILTAAVSMLPTLLSPPAVRGPYLLDYLLIFGNRSICCHDFVLIWKSLRTTEKFVRAPRLPIWEGRSDLPIPPTVELRLIRPTYPNRFI